MNEIRLPEGKIQNLDLLAAGVDHAINSKYPQISKRIVYPLRSKQFEIIQETWKKAYGKGRYYKHKERNREEEKEKVDYRKALHDAQIEKAKNFTLVAQKDTSEIPEIVKNAMISLKLYKTVPIIDGKLMCPVVDGRRSIFDEKNIQLPFFSQNGDLLPLTAKKLRLFIKANLPGDKILQDTKNLIKVPEYRIISTYINRPERLGKLQKMLDKDKEAFEDPKKMASRIRKKVFDFMNANDRVAENTATKNISPSDLKSYADLKKIIASNDNIDYFGSDNVAPKTISDFLIKKRALRKPEGLFQKLMTPEQKFLLDYNNQRNFN